MISTLRIASYFNLVVCFYNYVIISEVSYGNFLLRMVSLIIEQLVASSLVIVGVSLICSIAKSVTLFCFVAEMGRFAAFAASKLTANTT